jgi:hypothetical protein
METTQWSSFGNSNKRDCRSSRNNRITVYILKVPILKWANLPLLYIWYVKSLTCNSKRNSYSLLSYCTDFYLAHICCCYCFILFLWRNCWLSIDSVDMKFVEYNIKHLAHPYVCNSRLTHYIFYMCRYIYGHLCTRFHMPASCGSSGTAIELKAKDNFIVATLLFYIL